MHLTALNPAIVMSIALRRLSLSVIKQKMAGFLICFGKFAPFESTEIIYHIKLFYYVEGALVVTVLV